MRSIVTRARRLYFFPACPFRLTSIIRRERANRLTVAASVGAKAFSIVCTFAQVPIALHYLGAEAYGLWVTLFGVVLVLNTVDFGLGVGMQHEMARAFGRGDHEAMKRAFWTGASVLGVLGLTVLAFGIPIVRAGSWANDFHIHDETLRAETGTALLIAILSFAVGLPFNAATRLVAAVQRGWINAGWIAIGSALSLLMVSLAAVDHWGFLWFLVASLFIPSLQGRDCYPYTGRPQLETQTGGPRPVLGDSPDAKVESVLRIPPIWIALLQSAPALAISIAAGSSAVTGYNLLVRLFGPFQQGQVILLTPIWPAYTEAHEKADHHWIKRTFGRTLAAFGAFAIGLVAVGWQSHRLLTVWVGPSSADLVSSILTRHVAIWCLLQMLAQPFLYFLVGVGRLRQLAWAATPGLVISASVLFSFAHGGTVDEILDAGSLALAFTLLPFVAWQVFSYMRRQDSGTRNR